MGNLKRVQMRPIFMDIAARDEHVPDVERAIRTIKNDIKRSNSWTSI